MFLAYPAYAALLLAFTWLQWLFSPLLALLVNAQGHLPHWLMWFETFDATVDEGWQGGYYPKPNSKLALWWCRVKWLCRNPAYGFAYYPLGLEFNPDDWSVWFKRYPNGRDMLFFAIGPDGAFDLHFRFGLFAGKFGWKCYNTFDEARLAWKTKPWGPEWRIPCCFSPQLIFRK